MEKETKQPIRLREKEIKLFLLEMREEWQNDHQGCENFIRLIEKKYNGNYDYYCTLARKTINCCLKRNGQWLFKSK